MSDQATEKTHADYAVQDEGTVVLLWAISDEAVAWCDEHLPARRIRWGGATVIERRYVEDILNGMGEDGLVGKRL